jgi:MFS family permease
VNSDANPTRGLASRIKAQIASPIGKLLALRWTGQLSDGIFQSGLASFILFSPERQPDAFSVALAFAVVLLPYSLIGPFVGTILDRFSRQRILFISNISRAIVVGIAATSIAAGATGLTLTALVLVAFGINRLILAGLSASLPLLVSKEKLVAINATAVTGGTIFVVLGGGIGIGVRGLLSDLDANRADSIVITVAGSLFLLAGLLSLRLKKSQLGPMTEEISKGSFLQGIHEMRDGFHRLRSEHDPLLGILATAIHRGGLTALTLMALLLQRNTFNPSDDPDAGLQGFALSAVIAGIGIGIGAIVAPFGVARFGRHRWIRWMLMASAITPIFLSLQQSEVALLATGFLTSACGQGVKVTNDALVQSRIVDEFRGRVFAVYDVIVNFAIVTGAIVAALLLPTSGEGALLPAVIALLYLIFAVTVLSPQRFHSPTTT